MSRKIALRPKAEADLDGIWAYTAEAWSQAQAQAISYLTGMDAVFRLLVEFPEMARLRQDFSPPVRIHPFREHLIVFSSDDTMLDIIRIVHSRANWSEFLAE